MLSLSGDERGLAKAHWLAFELHWLGCRATGAGNELRAAAEHAVKAGDEGLRSRALGWYMTTLMFGPENTQTIANELTELEREARGPFLAGHIDFARAELARLAGNLSEAQRLAHRAIDGYVALALGKMAGGMEQHLGHMELLGGDPAAAVASLLRSDEILAKLGARDLRSTTQANLAQAYERIGDAQAARAAVALADEQSVPEDVVNPTITHQVRARLALAEGDSSTAERWARSAVDHARPDRLRGLRGRSPPRARSGPLSTRTRNGWPWRSAARRS